MMHLASNHEIFQFLDSIDMKNYFEVFMNNGFDDMDVLKG